ncbi:MAG: hypothetical protein ACM30H_04705 [Clostridia bacterium]
MRPDLIDRLRDARDFYSLTKAVLQLCEPFGPVHAFRLVHNRGASRVACFIELESLKQQPVLARALGCRTLNGAVCLEIPVAKDFPGEAKVIALAGPYERVPAPRAAGASSAPSGR